ncbi:MAG: VWA domain-containing protein [Chloroflexi bacterium]|nr:VWA domain-containing protein [Chloroflexota bacterium]
MPKDASAETIRDAFASLLSQFKQESEDQPTDPAYERILHAYNVLNDPDRRATYDSLMVELETAVSPLIVNIQASRDQIPLSESAQLIYLLVDLLPPETYTKSNRSLNMSLIIDRSTSMKGERLKHVKSALELLINKLAPDDVISVVSFSDRAEVVVPSESASNKQALMSKVRSIFTSGGTEIYQGLAAGMNQIRQAPLSQHTNHLILLTDGHTYGDADQCLQLAREAARQNVDFSAFGIGSEWNDQFLDKLVAPSGGQSQYIETPIQIIDFLRERIKGLGNIYARDLRLSTAFPKSVTPQFSFKLSPFAQPLALNGDEIMLGNIEGRQALSFLLELRIEPQTINARINIPLNFTAKLPQQPKHTFKHQFQISALADAHLSDPPPDIKKAVRLLNMYRMNEKVMDDVEAGRLEAATRRMRHLTTRLLEVGETKLAQQAHAEGDRLASMGTLSLEGRKKLKFGTRALLAQTITSIELELEK